MNAWSSRASGSYGYPVIIQVWSSRHSSPIASYTTKSGGNWSDITFDWSVNSPEATNICVVYICGQTGGCAGGSQDIWNGGQNAGHQGDYWCQVYGLQNNTLSFEAGYRTPTIENGISGTAITRYDVNRTVTIGRNTSGDNNYTSVYVNINGTDTSDIGISNNSSNYTFKPSNYSVSDGQSYKVYARRVHSKKTSLYAKSNTLTLYTYRTPLVKSLSLSDNNFSGIGNATLYWYTNGRRWSTTYEDAFVTTYRFGSKNWLTASNQGPGKNDENILKQESQNITSSILESVFTAAERSVDKISTTVTVKRTNPSSGVEATQSTNITIQYTPKYAPSKLVYRNNSTNDIIAQGSTVYLDEVPKIKCEWTYPDKVDRGVISGYVLRIYEDSSYENLVTEKYITSTSLTGSTVLTTRTDLKRGQLNYITLSAYYIRPNTKEKVEGPLIKQTFVLPLGKLYPPNVPYPVNKTRWHNKNFRILMELPFDDDYDALDDYIQTDTYRYKDIELVINGTSYLWSQNKNLFSTETLGYQYRICINPSLLSNFVDTNEYNIKLRVQKNYYKNIWSEYTSLTLYVTKITNLSLVKEQIILIDHYKYVQSASERLWNVYPISSKPANNKDLSRGDIIYYNNYTAIYNTVLQIQNDVNNWARFDSNKFNVKFNQTINTLSGSNTPTNDYITAAKDERPIKQGRNYMNICIDCMNKLF